MICGCGFPDWEGNFESLKLMCRLCFRTPEMVLVPETPMLNVAAAAAIMLFEVVRQRIGE